MLPENNDEYQVKLHASFSQKEKKDQLFYIESILETQSSKSLRHISISILANKMIIKTFYKNTSLRFISY